MIFLIKLKKIKQQTNEPLNIVNNKDNLYINNEESKVIKEEKVYGAPVKLKVPNIEMPKFASAPKDSVRVTNTEPVLNHKEEEPKYDTPNFENIENETFSLK